MAHRTPLESYHVVMMSIEELVVKCGGVLDMDACVDLADIGTVLVEALGLPEGVTPPHWSM
ncbi:hypothetical protein ACFOKI_07415 [Sphingomonas qilianensis]|uniref:hypothetical protein n=1 Tax=Sphingomonas qilianensis TaxID=1736690 RepID=UPI00361B16C4